ncbi:phage protein, HK97 gp10 family [compost metagenome]
MLPKSGETAETTANAPTPHWRLLEFGTEKMRAQPFMRSALADHISEVTGVFVSEYEKSIDRALRRAKKKQGV